MIVEVRTFRLAAGAAEGDLLAVDRRVQEAAMFAHGFVRRTTARRGDRWLVETLWYDDDAADRFVDADHDAVAAFDALADPDSVHVERFETLD